MTRIERKLLIQNAVLGACLTLLVLGLDWGGDDGALAPMERWLNDVRARHCQFNAKPPSNQLVHLDIDNEALQTIGSWPWRRSLLADMTRELDRAGAKVIAFDVLFSEPQTVDYAPLDGEQQNATKQSNDLPTLPKHKTSPQPNGHTVSGIFQKIDEDATFAAAIRDAVNVILPAQFHAASPLTTDGQFVLDFLVKEKLKPLAAHIATAFSHEHRDVPALLEIENMRSELRPRAMYILINNAFKLTTPTNETRNYPTLDQLRKIIWPDGTWIAASLNPVRAFISSCLLITAYLGFNGLVLFDQGNYVVSMAGPVVAVAVVWSSCTLARFVVEKSERARITRRFRSYVDPTLVDYVIDHPEHARLSGQVRELTVVFTDLENFTALNEQLQERTVPILNEFMERMVKIIRDESKPIHRRGYVNKFLGDGLMFFFGSPYDNESHAIDAVTTVMRMQDAMVDFNQFLTDQDLPEVRMRAGISTGNMVVGDAGAEDASDYTVLGDAVNFGSRLEGANKATGTLVLISEQTMQFAKDLVLCRPVAKLQVVGKSVGVNVYEPIVPADKASDQQQEFVAATASLIDAFTAKEFSKCINLCDLFDTAFGQSELSLLYRDLCNNYIKQPPPPDFDGTITLSEK